MDTRKSADTRARLLVDAMTLQQKTSQTHGAALPEDFRIVVGIDELCIPALTVTNGPAGVGTGPQILNNVPATALPSPLSLASTWDPWMAYFYGWVQGREMRHIGRNLLEAPDVDLARTPLNGRTFEAYGEDPHLISRIGVANIKAIQSHDIIAMAKHYTVNNQENNRFNVDVQIDERTLREIYMPPFEAAVVEAKVSSIMCAYNFVEGFQACESPHTLMKILKQDWGFKGFVQSDFFAARDTVGTAVGGMDLEMPQGNIWGDQLRDAVLAGQVPESRVDDMLRRRYREMFRFGLFDRVDTVTPIPAEKHGAIARAISAAGTILLRNEGNILPLNDKRLSTIAVVGPWSTQAATGGGGSSFVNPIRKVTPLEGITARVGGRLEIVTDDGTDPSTAAQAAADADVAIVVVGDFESEGVDRTDLILPDNQDAIIEAVARANPNTVVVMHAGAPMLMPWRDRVSAILNAWYPGGEDGLITAALLFGDATPTGRLPITIPANHRQGPLTSEARYPGVDGKVFYDEGLLVGYRWYQAKNQTPTYPFGFGLSYTTFKLNKLRVTPRVAKAGKRVKVRVRLKNTGKRLGAEVVQVYVGYPKRAGEPPKQLRAFKKVWLKPGKAKTVTLSLDARAFSIWDEKRDDWRILPGFYTIMVGTASDNTPLRKVVLIL